MARHRLRTLAALLLCLTWPSTTADFRYGCGRTALHGRASMPSESKLHLISDLDALAKGMKRSIVGGCGNEDSDANEIKQSAVGAVSSVNRRKPDVDKDNKKSITSLTSITSKRTGIQSTDLKSGGSKGSHLISAETNGAESKEADLKSNSLNSAELKKFEPKSDFNELKSDHNSSLEETISIAKKLNDATNTLNKDILHLPDSPEPAVTKDHLHLPESIKETVETKAILNDATNILNKDILHLPGSSDTAAAKDTQHIHGSSNDLLNVESKPEVAESHHLPTENPAPSGTDLLHLPSKNVEVVDVPSGRKSIASESLNHVFKDIEIADRRMKARKPNLKTLKNSPLWSLSKLIDDVSGITGNKKSSRFNSSEIMKSDEKKNNDSKSNRSNFLRSSFNGGKLFAARFQEKFSMHQTGQKKSDDGTTRSISSTNKTNILRVTPIKEDHAMLFNSTSTNKSENSTKKNATKHESNAPIDPYAEIAAGPDRPKIPELKSDDTTQGTGPFMKMDQGGMEQIGSQPSMKSFKPLSGQHDVGGLLDSLTDKLNSAGGGAAPDQPLTLPQDVQNQFNNDDPDSSKDPQDPHGMEKQSVNPPPIGDGPSLKEDQQLQEQIHKMVAEKEVSRLDQQQQPPQQDIGSRMEQAAAAVGLDKDVMMKLANSDESFSKSLTDKDGPISRFGNMDMIKDQSKMGQEMPDFVGADISTGPDPYSNPSEQGMTNDGIPSMGTEYGRRPNLNDMDSSDLMNGVGAGLSSMANEQEQGMNQGMQQDSASYQRSFDQMGLRSYENNGDINANTRSSENKEDSYLSAAIGAMGVGEAGAYVRQNIPKWGNAYDDIEHKRFSNNYNTHMFKKHVILRPKRDLYVSPFPNQESYDNDW